jgi:RNA recognition motif-containing protein
MNFITISEPKKLFIGNLSTICTEEIIFQEFSKYGTILEVQIRKNRSGTSSGYGFIKMNSVIEANIAISALDGTLLCGRNISVRDADSNVRSNNNFNHSYSLYIKFESIIPGKRTDEIKLRDIFSRYGEIIDVTVRRIDIRVIYSHTTLYLYFLIINEINRQIIK